MNEQDYKLLVVDDFLRIEFSKGSMITKKTISDLINLSSRYNLSNLQVDISKIMGMSHETLLFDWKRKLDKLEILYSESTISKKYANLLYLLNKDTVSCKMEIKPR